MHIYMKSPCRKVFVQTDLFLYLLDKYFPLHGLPQARIWPDGPFLWPSGQILPFFRTFLRQKLVLADLFYDFQDKFYLLQNLPQAVIWPELPPGLLSGQILPYLQPFTNKNLTSRPF